MDWTKVLGPLVGSLGPVLGGLVAGPAGAAIGGVLGKALAEAAGVEATPEGLAGASPAAVSAAVEKVSADQEILARIVALEVEETKRLQLEIADLQAARQVDLARIQSGHASAWTPTVLALLVLGVFAGVSYAGLAVKFDTVGREVFLFIAGQWSGFAGMGLSFFLGSSRGSREKDDVIAHVVRQGGK